MKTSSTRTELNLPKMSRQLVLDKVQEVWQVHHMKNVFGIKKPTNDDVIALYKQHIITLGHRKYDHLSSTFAGKIEGKTVDELVKKFQTSSILCISFNYSL